MKIGGVILMGTTNIEQPTTNSGGGRQFGCSGWVAGRSMFPGNGN